MRKAIKFGAAVAALVGVLAIPAAASAQLFDASSGITGASAAPVDLSGVATLGKSNTSQGSSNVQVLNVAGTNLLSKSGGANHGALAPVGNVVDSLNKGDCKKGPDNPGFCLVVLYSNQTDSGNPTANSNSASYTTAGVHLGQEKLFVLGSQAGSASGGGNCFSFGRSYLLIGEGPTAIPTNDPGIDNSSVSGPGAC
jgi:hypothetical protein